MKTNKNGVKLLAIVAVFAMVVGVFAVVSFSEDANADATTVTIEIEEKGDDVVYTKNGTTYTPEDKSGDTVLITTKELAGISKVVVNVKSGDLGDYLGVVWYSGEEYNGDIEFNMSGGTVGWVGLTDVDNETIKTAGATWKNPAKVAKNIVANISGGTITTIQPVINYLAVDNYSINVSGEASIGTLKTAGSNGSIGTEKVTISGGAINKITAQRSVVGSIGYDISGGTINYFAIGANVNGANETSDANLETGFVTGNVDLKIAEAATVPELIIGGGILDMPLKNANGNDISDYVMSGTVTIDAPNKTIKLQNSFYGDGTGQTISSANETKIKEYWNGENVFGNTITACKDLVIKAGTLSMPAGGQYFGKISFNGGSILMNGTTAGEGGITLSEGSIVINGEIDDSVEGQIKILSGTAKLVADVPNNTTIIIDSGATLEVPTGKSVSNAGTIVNNGSIVNKGTVNNTGTINIIGSFTGTAIVSTGTVTIPAGSNASDIVSGGTISTSTGSGDSFGMKDMLESDYTVITSSFLSGKLVIPAGITLTIKGVLDLNNNELVVEGKLVIESKGSIVGYISTEDQSKITISKDGVIKNNGLIGNNSFVTIQDQQTPAASVIMKNVAGIGVSLTKVVGNSSVDYVLTVSGEAVKKGDSPALQINNAYIDALTIKDLSTGVVLKAVTVVKNGTLTIDTKAVVSIIKDETQNAVTLNNGAVLTIDGKVISADVTDNDTTDVIYMKNGSTVIVNGNVDATTNGTSPVYTHKVVFESKAGSFKTYSGDAKVDPESATEIASSFSTIELTDVTGITIEVTSRAYTTTSGTAMTEQMMNISGTVSLTKKTESEYNDLGKITITEEVYVSAGDELVLSKGMSIDTTNGKLIAKGTVKTVDVAVTNYVGSSYSVKVTPETGTSYITYYYTTFDAALAAIDSSDDKTVTLKGGYSFNKSFTVKAGQTITFGDALDYKISKDAIITVEKDGTLSGGFVASTTEVAAGIQGVLIVMDGGDCKPTPKSYEVMSKDADNNVTYSGAAIAIENAQPGSTIYIVDTVTFKDKVTIPKDVTVDVASTATINAQKGLVVDGTIDNEGAVNIGVNSDLVVSGTVNNEGSVTFTAPQTGNTTGQATITGKFVGTISGAAKINAAYYQDGTDTIYTSVDAAVKAVAQMDVMSVINVTGKFSENADITLADGMIVNINGEITLSSIRLVAGSTLNIAATAALTTDVVGAVGKADTTGAVSDAIVDVSKLKNAAFTLTYNESNTTYTMTMTLSTGYTGDVKVAQGSVALAADNASLTFAEGKTLAIASGATLVVNKDSLQFSDVAGDKKYFSNEGILSVKKNMTLVNAVIGGEVVVEVEKTLTITGASAIVGTVTLSEKTDKTSAKIVINGIVRIGSAPETLGAAGTVSGDIDYESGYAIVYAGSTFDDKTNVDAVKSTKYVINGIDYATIYTEASDVSITVLDSEILALDDIASTDAQGREITIDWYADGAKITSANVGLYDEITATLAYSAVTVKVSAAPGLTVYIDNLVADTTEKLAIGTHTIIVYLDPNYQGTPVVTLNGKTVSGSFEITTDMLGGDNIISVTGATYVAPGTGSGSSGSSSDDGMSITDYLLIVLVVLIVIMAVLVAIRMMRS